MSVGLSLKSTKDGMIHNNMVKYVNVRLSVKDVSKFPNWTNDGSFLEFDPIDCLQVFIIGSPNKTN